MVKMFYKILFTTMLSLFFVSPSFGMDAYVSLDGSESSGTSPFLRLPDLNVKDKKNKKARKNYEKAKAQLEKQSNDLSHVQAAKALMRKAAAGGSKEATAFRKDFGHDNEDFLYACTHFKEPKGQSLMKMLAAEGHKKAQDVVESMGFKDK